MTHIIRNIISDSRVRSAHYFLKSSYGNDSVAMIQWAYERGLRNVTILYSDTGWSAPNWHDRVSKCEIVAQSYGFVTLRIASVGFKELVRQRKGFPRQGMQYCTEELKIRPSQKVMDDLDPLRQWNVLVGKRREESANRAKTPEFVENSPFDDGRTLWHPLFAMKSGKRDALVRRFGCEPLSHRSMECYPCINSNRADLRALSADRVAEIEAFETEMGVTTKGKPITMFRPYRYMGATGIHQIKKWADSEHGKFSLMDGTAGEDETCYSGQCGI